MIAFGVTALGSAKTLNSFSLSDSNRCDFFCLFSSFLPFQMKSRKLGLPFRPFSLIRIRGTA